MMLDFMQNIDLGGDDDDDDDDLGDDTVAAADGDATDDPAAAFNGDVGKMGCNKPVEAVDDAEQLAVKVEFELEVEMT